MTSQNVMKVVCFKSNSGCLDKNIEVIAKTGFEEMTQRNYSLKKI